MKTEFLNKRLERLEQLNLLRDLDFEEGRELAEIKRIKQLIIDSVSNQKELLISFCKHGGIQSLVPTKAESIEQLVDDYLSN